MTEKAISKKAVGVKNPKLGVMPINITANSKYRIFIFIICLLYIFFSFFLKDKVLYTPDFNASDIFHINYSLKHYLAQNYKQGILPLWTDLLQGGFPLLAESQIGAFFVPNILFLALFPLQSGFQLLFAFTIFCMALGTYCLLADMKIRPHIAFLLALNFVFCGAISLRFMHFNLTQVVSLFPWLFLLLRLALRTGRKIYSVLFSIVLSQMIMAGYMQLVFISLVSLTMWFGIFVFRNKKDIKRLIIFYALIIAAGFALALPQILPTYNLGKNSFRGLVTSYEYAVSIPFTWKDLLAFVLPTPYGSLKTANYTPYKEDYEIYWESTPFLGASFVIAAIYSLAAAKKKKNPWIYEYGIPVLLLLLLALGKHSPLHIVFAYFPFNLFRAPPKFLIPAVLFIFIVAGKAIESIMDSEKRASVILPVVLLLNLYLLINFTFSYHPFVDYAKTRANKNFLNHIQPGNTLNFLTSSYWNKIFINEGWNEKNLQKYLFMLNFVQPNSNLIYNFPNFGLNTGGLRLRRPDYFTGDIMEGFGKSGTVYAVSTSSANLLRTAGITNIITPYKIAADSWKLIDSITQGKATIFLYGYDGSRLLPYYIPDRLVRIDNLGEFDKLAFAGTISDKNASIETGNSHSQQADVKRIVADYSSRPLERDIKVNFAKPGILVLRENNYQNWQAFIDGKNIKIDKVNLIHMGVMVPEGVHQIRFVFSPAEVYYGAAAAAAMTVLYLFALKYLVKIPQYSGL